MNEIILNDIIEQFKRFEKSKVLNSKYRKAIESLIAENKELKSITTHYEAYECEAPKNSKAKIIIADKFYFNNGYFKNNFIEIDKIKRVFEDFEKIMKEGEENV